MDYCSIAKSLYQKNEVPGWDFDQEIFAGF
jgi:hypothetical protein